MRTSYDADDDDDDEDESDNIDKDDMKESNATRCRPSRREGGRRLGVANQPMIKHPAMITSRKSRGDGGDQAVATTTQSTSTASSTASTSACAIIGDLMAAASSDYAELATETVDAAVRAAVDATVTDAVDATALAAVEATATEAPVATATEAVVATVESENAGPTTAASETIAAQLHDLQLH